MELNTIIDSSNHDHDYDFEEKSVILKKKFDYSRKMELVRKIEKIKKSDYLINIFKIISNKKKKERLVKTGTVIEATYIETNTNFNLRVLGRNPSNIICEYDDPISKNTYRFKSERLWYDPTLYIGDNDIYTFNVYVNKDNMKDYYVDIEKLIDKE